jgi:L-asparaginase / beta-aspartyl-peptidase
MVSMQEAADTVIMEKLTHLGGTGGVIALDKDGNHAWPFNTSGMYRGFSMPPAS